MIPKVELTVLQRRCIVVRAAPKPSDCGLLWRLCRGSQIIDINLQLSERSEQRETRRERRVVCLREVGQLNSLVCSLVTHPTDCQRSLTVDEH